MSRTLTGFLAALVACCGRLGPALAQSDAPAPGSPPSINARQLGIADAVLEYCKKAYPSSNEKWQFEVKRLSQGASAETLKQVRSSDAYRQAYTAESNFVAQIEPNNAKRVCARSLARKQEPPSKKATSDKPASEKAGAGQATQR